MAQIARDGKYRVRNATRSASLADASDKASNPISRGKGLIGRKTLLPGQGLIIQPCNSIVMFFMRFPLDVVFVDGNGNICHLLREIKPWRTSSIVRGSKYVVELPAGTIESTGTEVGDKIEIEAA
jgi:uncharacterized membrane protein (UPF0127 family)